MSPRPFVLASASPRRRDLLAQIGAVPDAILPADIDEAPKKRELPRHYALRMASNKASIIASQNPEALILAADTTVAVGRRILGKPTDADEAAAFLALLSGRRHRVITALALKTPNKDNLITRVVISAVRFAHLTPSDRAEYIASGEWQGKAGGYAIQGRGGAFVAWMQGSYTGIIGLPLMETRNLLKGVGVALKPPIIEESGDA